MIYCKMTRTFKFLIILILIVFVETKSFGQDTICKYNLFNRTDGGLEIDKLDVSFSETRNRFFSKLIYADSLLRTSMLFDKDAKLYDDIFIPAVTTYEYKKNRLTFFMYFDKFNKRTECFFGEYKTEYIYDNRNRVIKEIKYDKDENIVSYLNEDGSTPYSEYKYNGKTCMKFRFDNDYNLVDSLESCNPLDKIKIHEKK